MKLKIYFAIFIICFLSLGIFLDVTQQPKKADIIFCFGGKGKSRILKSLQLLHDDFSSKNKLYFSAKKEYLLYKIKDKKDKVKFIKRNNVIFIENLKNTMEEVKYLDDLMNQNKLTTVLIVSDPPHSRRIELLIKEFADHLEGKYIIVSSNAAWWNKYFYFANWNALKFSILEVIKIFYNSIKYTLFDFFDKDIYRSDKIVEKT